MKVFTCTNFHGHYPIGTAAVIVADDKAAALTALLQILSEVGLPQTPEDIDCLVLQEVPMSPGVMILCDGNY